MNTLTYVAVLTAPVAIAAFLHVINDDDMYCQACGDSLPDNLSVYCTDCARGSNESGTY